MKLWMSWTEVSDVELSCCEVLEVIHRFSSIWVWCVVTGSFTVQTQAASVWTPTPQPPITQQLQSDARQYSASSCFGILKNPLLGGIPIAGSILGSFINYHQKGYTLRKKCYNDNVNSEGKLVNSLVKGFEHILDWLGISPWFRQASGTLVWCHINSKTTCKTARYTRAVHESTMCTHYEAEYEVIML